MSLHKPPIDVSSYAAIGDSITAGYTDGALCYYGQQNSFANLLAGQFKLIGGNYFKQPLVNPDSVGISFSGTSRLVLKNGTKDAESSLPYIDYLASSGDSTIFSSNSYGTQGPFNNFGVPGSKVLSLAVPGYGNPLNGAGSYNPFFSRMASNPASSSILSDALDINPTFFSLFIGNNDVLAYALSGGTSDSITPVHGAPGIGFESSLLAIINALMANGAKGVIANLGDITSVPFFNTIPYNGLLLNAESVAWLNNKYARSGIHFHVGKNPFIIIDPVAGGSGLRPIEKKELILLDILLDPFKEHYLDGSMAIPEKYVLTSSKILEIQTAIKSYNAIIKTIALSKGLALVDTNAILRTAAKERFYIESTHSITYKKRGVFSLDGLHPNLLGHVLLTNEFIKVINQTYNSCIPIINSTIFKIMSQENS